MKTEIGLRTKINASHGKHVSYTIIALLINTIHVVTGRVIKSHTVVVVVVYKFRQTTVGFHSVPKVRVAYKSPGCESISGLRH